MEDISVNAIVKAMSELVLESTKSSICSYPVQFMKSPRLSENPADISPAKVFKLQWLPTVSLHPYYAHGDGMVSEVNSKAKAKASSVSVAPKVYRGSSYDSPMHTDYWVHYRPAKECHMRRDDLRSLHCYFSRKSWKSRKMEIKAMLDGVVARKVAQYISDNEDRMQVCMEDISVNAIVKAMSELVLESTKSSICSYPVQIMKSPRLTENPADISPAKNKNYQYNKINNMKFYQVRFARCEMFP
jgi:hypothetical protein